jgi:hypothetical protein
MKKITCILITLIAIQTSSYISAMTLTESTGLTISANKVERFPVHFVFGSQLYTAGGTTFIYPTNAFTGTPAVYITVEAAAHADNETYTTEISTNDALSATVKVYKISSGGTIAEAATNEITICLFASGK